MSNATAIVSGGRFVMTSNPSSNGTYDPMMTNVSVALDASVYTGAEVRVKMNFENPEVTAKAGIKEFRKFLRSIGMPINFAELGARAEDIPVLVEKHGLGDGKTGGFVQLSADDIAEILNIAVNAEV